MGGNEQNLKILLYYDAPNQWPSVYPSNKTCMEKEAILWDGIGQIVPLSTSISEESGCVQKEDAITRCSNYRRFRSSRPRWWFIALADCSSKTGLNISYWISLTNAPHGYITRIDNNCLYLCDTCNIKFLRSHTIKGKKTITCILQNIYDFTILSISRNIIRNL